MERERLKSRERSSSLKSRRFVISATAKPSCSQGTSSVSRAELAEELGVTLAQLQPLVDHGYLRPISLSEVIRPAPAALAWLRGMFQPLTLRPWLPTKMVAELAEISAAQVRSLCLMYDIPLAADAVFGELMSVTSFQRFFHHLYHLREPSRFDRQNLLRILLRAARPLGPEERPLPTLPFSKRLETEIRRIARMPEPERTFASTALLEAYREAKSVSDAYHRYKGRVPPEIAGMDWLERVVERSVG